MNRIIRCEVENEYVHGAGVVIGAAGSHDDVELELTFSPVWDGTSKKIVWFDALNDQTVVTALTTDLLVAGEANLYRVPVPGEAKAVEGDMHLTIRGANVDSGVETRAVVTATACFRVLPALWDPLAVESSEPSASVSDQLQQEIEDIKSDIADAAKAASALAETKQAAAEAAGSAETAKQYAGKPPVIENGTWHIWNAEKQSYTDTLLPARGEVGPQGATGGVWYPSVSGDGTLTFSRLVTETPPPAYNIRGPQGLQGDRGPAGPAGVQGIQGPRGVQGERGARGETGPAGPAGVQGPAGPAGPQGQKGDDGADGRDFTILSRYDTLLALHNAHPRGEAGDAYAVGTAEDNTVYLWDVDQAEWADIGPIQGPAGAKGDAGATGPQGPKGDTGAAGPQGPKGDAGATGPQGPAGAAGPAGPGLPTGGTVDQVPAKASTTDYDTKWVTPVGKSMAGQSVQPTSGTTVTAGEGAEIFNDYRARTFSGKNVTAGNVASGAYSHAEGLFTTASGSNSHAEGRFATASGNFSHAEGYTSKASGYYSHAEGQSAVASGSDSHAEGRLTEAIGGCSHAEGESTTASGDCSHAEGFRTIASAENQHVIGCLNVEYSDYNTKFIIGSGIFPPGVKANCFRVTHTGTYAAGSYNASGADYAELFEWADGNPAGEDRAGRFVTLTGDKLRLAGPGDSYILGIVSGNPSIIGDVHDDQWAGMYLYDVFGRPLWEDVEVPDKTVEEPDPEHPGQTVTRVIRSAHTEHRQQLNPAYDGTKPYTARTERPEWDAVGLMGKLVAVDDGTCQVDGYCTVGEGGGATASEQRTRYRVMKRLDGNHVQVMVLP